MPEVLANQVCPVCNKNTLELREDEQDIPFFGKTYLFSMSCSSCNFHQSDVEAAEQRDPAIYTIEVNSEEDMKIRIVKSSQATVKIPHVVTITPGPGSDGYVSNIEGILTRVKDQIQAAKDNEEDEEARKKAKNLLKKLNRVIWGQEKLTITIEDPSGNSAIISDKTVVKKPK